LLYAAVRTFSLYIFGPALYAYLMYVAVAKRAPYQRAFGFTFQPARVLAYYGTLVIAVFASLWTAAYVAG
jgi:hypothetical protein